MKIFLDTNVLIDWLFLKDKSPDQLAPLPKGQQASVALFKDLKTSLGKHDIMTSFHGLAEAQGAIIRHKVSTKLLQNDIPLQYYAHYESEMRQNHQKDIEALALDLLKLTTELNMFVYHLIVDNSTIGKIYEAQREYQLPATDTMILMTAGTSDAQADVFVTKDRHFLENKKQIEKDFALMIVSPQELLNLLRKCSERSQKV